MQERRTEVRMMCADMVEVRWKDTTGRRQSTVGLLEDISASGACLQMESPLPLGAPLTLACPDQEFTGTVRYCAYREIGYFVGVQFTGKSRWSEHMFMPQHLLDPRELAAHTKK